MEKLYLDKDVYQAVQERFDYIFREFDNVYVSFSGGKDSGVLLSLLLKYMQERGITRKIGLFYKDFEAQYQETTDYVERVFQDVPDFVERFWCCFPIAVRNAMSAYEPYWMPWDESKRDVWCRERPEHDYVYSLDNNPFGDWYTVGMPSKDFYPGFERWYQARCGGGATVALSGVRADESLTRYRSIAKKVHMHGDEKWTYDLGKGMYVATPLYDWRVEDVWIANGKFGFDYNHLYDIFYKAGIPINDMRVASPFIPEGRKWLNAYRIIDQQAWEKLVKRVSGANFGGVCGGAKVYSPSEVKLPHGHTWQSYAQHLLDTLPDTKRRTFEKVIEKTDHPDWRMMCVCILNNDYTCNVVGKAETEKRQKSKETLKEKYKMMMRGDTNV